MLASVISRIFLISLFLCAGFQVQAANFNEGAKKCQECHDQEYEVWKNSPHFATFKTMHKKDEAKKIIDAVGEKSMKRSDDCVICHYTQVQKSEGDKAKVKSGPSCESCHGASSSWRAIHNDYGGPKVKAADETPEHRKMRLAESEANGMIASRMVFRIASSCMACHGLANDAISADTLGKMLESGHPIEPDFEIVKYSQGDIRHRFVPPDVTVNSKMDAASTARLFLGGQAAALVAATRVKGKVDNADFNSAQDKRIATATAALNAVKGSIPEAAALLSDPSEMKALAFEAALQGKDLSGSVAQLLPDPSSYK